MSLQQLADLFQQLSQLWNIVLFRQACGGAKSGRMGGDSAGLTGIRLGRDWRTCTPVAAIGKADPPAVNPLRGAGPISTGVGGGG
jgi:hypothetical protein